MAGGERNEEAREDLLAGVNELLGNIPDVELNLSSQPDRPLQGHADFAALTPEVGGGARILLDTRSLLAAGEDVLTFTHAFAGRIGLVQLGDQTGGAPVPLGLGDLPLSQLIEQLKETDYNSGYLVIDEPPASREDATAAVRAARELVEALL